MIGAPRLVGGNGCNCLIKSYNSEMDASLSMRALVALDSRLRVEGALLRAADEVSVRLGLPPTWLNTDVQLLRHALPDGWEARCATIHVGDALEVRAIGRIDLLCMKIYAGRPQDLEDLRSMSPTGDELGFARSYVEALRSRGEPDTHVADARAVIAFLGGADGA